MAEAAKAATTAAAALPAYEAQLAKLTVRATGCEDDAHPPAHPPAASELSLARPTRPPSPTLLLQDEKAQEQAAYEGVLSSLQVGGGGTERGRALPLL